MNNKKILIADDEPQIRLLISTIISKKYDILIADDGQQAIDIAYAENPDLILMDIIMPKLDGYHACSAIKNNQLTRNIPIIMLSGIEYPLNKKLASEVGANGYITKPFSPKQLLETIGQYLKHTE